MGTVCEYYISILIFSEKKFVFEPRKYPYLTENPKGTDIQMSKYDSFEHWHSTRGVKWSVIRPGKNQGVNLANILSSLI